MKVNRLVLLALTGAVAFGLTGCQSGNLAAEVNGTEIDTEDVDFLTRMQCAAIDAAAADPEQAAQVQQISTREVRGQMVNALIQAELNRQLAEQEDADYDRATYRQVMDQFEPAVQAAPKEDRDRFRDLVGSFYRGQLEVYAVVQRKLAAAGVTQPGEQEMQEGVSAIQADFLKTSDVEINPVYGPDAGSLAGAVDPSLSLAVSDFAKESSSATPAPTFISRLPDDLRCG